MKYTAYKMTHKGYWYKMAQYFDEEYVFSQNCRVKRMYITEDRKTIYKDILQVSGYIQHFKFVRRDK